MIYGGYGIPIDMFVIEVTITGVNDFPQSLKVSLMRIGLHCRLIHARRKQNDRKHNNQTIFFHDSGSFLIISRYKISGSYFFSSSKRNPIKSGSNQQTEF